MNNSKNKKELVFFRERGVFLYNGSRTKFYQILLNICFKNNIIRIKFD